jgi:hypothetical protein
MNYKDKKQMEMLYEQKNVTEQFKVHVNSMSFRQQQIIAEKMWNQLNEQQQIDVLIEGNFFKDLGQKIGGFASKAAPFLGTVNPLLGAAAGGMGGALSGKGNALKNAASGALQGGMGMLGQGAGGLIGKLGQQAGGQPQGVNAMTQAQNSPADMAKAMFAQLMQNATPELMQKLFDQLTAKLGGPNKIAEIIQNVAGGATGTPASRTAMPTTYNYSGQGTPK